MQISRNETYLRMLGEVLDQQNIIGEILLVERAMVLLDIHPGNVSKDIDASFGPGEALREAAQYIARQEGLPPHWLKQAVESSFPERRLFDGATYPGLHIYVAPPGYVLTMSLLFGNQDDEFVRLLVKTLSLSTTADLLSLIKAYLPEQNIPSRVYDKIDQILAA